MLSTRHNSLPTGRLRALGLLLAGLVGLALALLPTAAPGLGVKRALAADGPAAPFGPLQTSLGAPPADPPLGPAFDLAAARYDVPRDLLLAIGYLESHWQSRHGAANEYWAYGVMGLTMPPGGDSLVRAATLVGLPTAQLQQDEASNILGAAALLHALAGQEATALGRKSDPGAWYNVLMQYAGGSDPRVTGSYAYEVLLLMQQGMVGPAGAGETLTLAAHPDLKLPVLVDPLTAAPASDDYPPALWVAANANNYQLNRPYGPLNLIVIHDTEGTYQAAISWFQNPASGVSAHYVIRSSDGQITQMVHNADTAYHAGNWDYNVRAIGIEHEGYMNQQGWYTEALYTASADLVRTMADRYGIKKDHAHIIGHYQIPNQSPPPHTDPGQYWNWSYYLSKVRQDWAVVARVDNTDSGFTPVPATIDRAHNWWIYPGGWNGSNAYMTASTSNPASSTNSGTWRATLPSAGAYDLYAYIPYVNNGSAETSSALYSVTTSSGTVQVTLNMSATTNSGVLQNGTTQGEWAHLGEFNFTTTPQVRLTDLTGDNGKNVWFDAMMWIPASPGAPQPTNTPTRTPTNTPTRTPTWTPTRTPTGVPPNTPTWTPTRTPTGVPTPCSLDYAVSQTTGAAVTPGTTDTGNHCDDCITAISLPFPVTLYDRTFSSANLSSNGTLQFVSNGAPYNNVCLPDAAHNYAIFPYWDDLRTDGAGQGIFTAVTGSAPNRVLHIEWRAISYTDGAAVNFEVRLTEGQTRFEVVYGAVSGGGNSATVGVQQDTGSHFTQVTCNAGGLSAGLLLSFTPAGCGTPTPPPPPTNIPTDTPSPTWTPGACGMRFNDLPDSHWAYGFVSYLYCHGVINGYTCGAGCQEFRVGASATRSQLAKMIVLGMNWPLQTPAVPTFSDVLAGDPFYSFVETAYSYGVVTGYGCGDGCLEFRPYDEVTRAQLSKMIALAKGWTLEQPSTPTFTDVPAGSWMYPYVETAAAHGIISGYDCGPGCVEFRPFNNVTRAQLSKMLALALQQAGPGRSPRSTPPLLTATPAGKK